MKKILLSALIVSSLISIQGQSVMYSVNFSGLNESPPNASLGIGTGTVVYDGTAHTMALSASFSGLLGPVTQTHIHGPTAVAFTGTSGIAVGNPSLPGFPLGVTSGTYANTMDLTLNSSYNNTFLANNGGTAASAEAALAAAMLAGKTYWNIHSTSVPGGEIRGFLTVVPEPSSIALAGLGVIGLAVRASHKRRASKA